MDTPKTAAHQLPGPALYDYILTSAYLGMVLAPELSQRSLSGVAAEASWLLEQGLEQGCYPDGCAPYLLADVLRQHWQQHGILVSDNHVLLDALYDAEDAALLKSRIPADFLPPAELHLGEMAVAAARLLPRGETLGDCEALADSVFAAIPLLASAREVPAASGVTAYAEALAENFRHCGSLPGPSEQEALATALFGAREAAEVLAYLQAVRPPSLSNPMNQQLEMAL